MACITLLVGAEVLRQVALFGFDRDYIHSLARLFKLDAERNLPTWFSTMQLFSAGMLALMISLDRRLARSFSHFPTMLPGIANGSARYLVVPRHIASSRVSLECVLCPHIRCGTGEGSWALSLSQGIGAFIVDIDQLAIGSSIHIMQADFVFYP